MPIQLTNPRPHPETGEPMTHAMADKIRIDLASKAASYIMLYGKIVDGEFRTLYEVGRKVHRDTPAEQQYGTDPDTGEPGNYESIPADPAFTTLMSMATHVVEADDVGKTITAYDLISENAIYTYEIATRPELFDGTIS